MYDEDYNDLSFWANNFDNKELMNPIKLANLNPKRSKYIYASKYPACGVSFSILWWIWTESPTHEKLKDHPDIKSIGVENVRFYPFGNMLSYSKSGIKDDVGNYIDETWIRDLEFTISAIPNDNAVFFQSDQGYNDFNLYNPCEKNKTWGDWVEPVKSETLKPIIYKKGVIGKADTYIKSYDYGRIYKIRDLYLWNETGPCYTWDEFLKEFLIPIDEYQNKDKPLLWEIKVRPPEIYEGFSISTRFKFVLTEFGRQCALKYSEYIKNKYPVSYNIIKANKPALFTGTWGCTESRKTHELKFYSDIKNGFKTPFDTGVLKNLDNTNQTITIHSETIENEDNPKLYDHMTNQGFLITCGIPINDKDESYDAVTIYPPDKINWYSYKGIARNHLGIDSFVLPESDPNYSDHIQYTDNRGIVWSKTETQIKAYKDSRRTESGGWEDIWYPTSSEEGLKEALDNDYDYIAKKLFSLTTGDEFDKRTLWYTAFDDPDDFRGSKQDYVSSLKYPFGYDLGNVIFPEIVKEKYNYGDGMTCGMDATFINEAGEEETRFITNYYYGVANNSVTDVARTIDNGFSYAQIIILNKGICRLEKPKNINDDILGIECFALARRTLCTNPTLQSIKVWERPFHMKIKWGQCFRLPNACTEDIFIKFNRESPAYNFGTYNYISPPYYENIYGGLQDPEHVHYYPYSVAGVVFSNVRYLYKEGKEPLLYKEVMNYEYTDELYPVGTEDEIKNSPDIELKLIYKDQHMVDLGLLK